MGIWAGIKHALNSTLGTSEFKSLDKIIEGQRSLAASDSVISVVFSGNQMVTNNLGFFSLGSFVPKKNGSVRVVLIGYAEGAQSNRAVKVIVRNNGTDSVSAVDASSVGGYSVFVDISVIADETYEVLVAVTNSIPVRVTNAKIGANIVDTSLVEVL